VGDFTCPDTSAASYLNRAVLNPGAVVKDAESRKSSKYLSLSAEYCYVPIAVETLDAPEHLHFLSGFWVSHTTGFGLIHFTSVSAR